MGKGARFVAATALIVVLVGLGAWWVLGDAGDGGATARAPVVAPLAAAPAASPELPETVADDAQSSAPERLAARPEAAPTPAPAELGVPVHFTGRVVDRDGHPVQGATVRVLPSGRLLKLLGVRIWDFEPTPDLARFAQTTSAADGTFAFDARDVPAEEASVAEHPNSSRSFEGMWPELVVSHPAFEATARACIGWSGSAFAAGDVVLGPGASVTGRAVDEDGRPLEDVLVRPPPLYDRWEGTPGNLWSHARLLLDAHSAADGTFRLDGLWPGKMSIGLEAKGRTSPVQELVLTAGEVRDLGDVTVGRGGTIEGWVIDARSGRPVPDARVLVRPPFESLFKGDDTVALAFASKVGINSVLVDHETHANEQGAFSVTGLDPATPAWDVFAGGPGYEPVKQSGVAADVATVSLPLQRAGLIVLTVTDADTQEPISGATIKAIRHSAEKDDYGTTTLEVVSDPQALAALEVPPPHAGVYALSPAGSFGNDAVVSAPGHATRGFKLPTVVAPERASHAVRLGPELVYAGRVIDPEGAPIADAKLLLHAPDDLRVKLPDRELRADAAGRFRFDALLDGDWDLTASAPRFVTSEPRRVALRKGQAAAEEDIVLQHAGAIAGVVTAGGAPQASVQVWVSSVAAVKASKEAKPAAKIPGGAYRPPPRPAIWKALTDAAGRFLIESLPPDDYELTGPPAVTMTVSVASGKTTEVTILARKRPRLHGHVYDERGPVAGAEVQAYFKAKDGPDWAGDETNATTEADGSWAIELGAPGPLTLSAVSDDAVTNELEMKVDWDDDVNLDLRFSVGAISGVLVDATGAPIAAARANLYRVITDENGETSNNGGRQATADERGHFEFDRLVAGRYMVRAEAAGFVRAESASIELADGEHAAPLSIVLQRAGTVRGFVKTAVPGGALPLPLSARFKGPAGSAGSTKIGADGRFTYDRLAPGTWTCEIYSPETSSKTPPLATCELQAVAGQEVEVSLQLP